MTWLIVLKVILLVRQMLKKIKWINEIRKVEINGKRLFESEKKLLTLFDNLLKTFLIKLIMKVIVVLKMKL